MAKLSKKDLRLEILFVIFLTLSLSLIRVFQHSYLYMDGSWQALYIASNKDFFLTTGREATAIFSQVFGVVAINVFENLNLRSLSFLLGFGTFFVPSFLLIFGVWLSRHNLSLLKVNLFSAILISTTTAFTMSESTFALSLFVLLFTILNLNLQKAKMAYWALVFGSILTIRTYDSYSMLSLVLLLQVYLALRRESISISKVVFPVIFLFIGFISSLFYTLKRSGVFTKDMLFVMTDPLLISIFLLPVTIFLLPIMNTFFKSVLLLLVSFMLIFSSNSFYLGNFFSSRVMITILIVSMYAIFPIIKELRWISSKDYFGSVSIPILIVVTIAYMYSSLNVYRPWTEYRSSLSNVVNSNTSGTKVLSFEDSGLDRTLWEQGGWAWTTPSLSVLLRESSTWNLVLNPISGLGAWEPWNPNLDSSFKSLPNRWSR